MLDGRFVFSGSLNWTISGILQNRENVMIVDNPATAAKYTAEFDKMWAMYR